MKPWSATAKTQLTQLQTEVRTMTEELTLT